MTREQVINRLQLGRTVGAEVRASVDDCRGFVFVRPKHDSVRAVLVQRDIFVEPLLHRRSPNEDVILSYDIEYTELRNGWEAQPDDWDRFVHTRERLHCMSLATLEAVLNKHWHLLIGDLQLPSNVDHPF